MPRHLRTGPRPARQLVCRAIVQRNLSLAHIIQLEIDIETLSDEQGELPQEITQLPLYNIMALQGPELILANQTVSDRNGGDPHSFLSFLFFRPFCLFSYPGVVRALVVGHDLGEQCLSLRRATQRLVTGPDQTAITMLYNIIT